MAISGNLLINIGLPNESQGSDSLYSAFNKINTNFNILFGNASKVVAGNGISVVNNPGNTVVSANLLAGDGIALDNVNGAIRITNTGGGNGGGSSNIVGILPGNGILINGSNSVGAFSGCVNVALSTTGVNAQSYINPTIIVDQFGRIVSAANNLITGTVTSVGLTPGQGISIAGGPITTSGLITVTNTGVTSLTAGSGISLSAANGAVTIQATGGGGGGGSVTSVGVNSNTGLVITNSPIISSGNIGVNLPANLSIVTNITAGGRFIGNANGLTGIPQGNLVGVDGNASNILYGNGVFANALSTVGATGATGLGTIGATGATGDRYSTTTSNSLSITSGSKTFTVGTGLAWSIGQSVVIANTVSQSMTGTISSYASGNGQMIVSISSTTGSGTYTSWTVNLAGAAGVPGATGLTGATGPVAGSNTQIVFNDAGTANGSANLTFNKTNNLLTIVGNIIANGTTTTGVAALRAGATNTLLPNTIASFTGNINNYAQITIQNKNSGANASADLVITADDGDDSTNYLDIGINNSGYDVDSPTNILGNIADIADGYIYAQGNNSNPSQSGGNLVIGTTVSGKVVTIFAGGPDTDNVSAVFANTGITANGLLSIGGNLTSANANLGNLAKANFFQGDGGLLSNISVATGSQIINGNSNVSVAANSNVNISAAGNANILVVTGTGANIAGTLNATGNANVGNLGVVTVIATTANLTTINSALLQNGNSNIAITNNGNITLNAVGGVVELTLTSTGANITGTLNATGNANVGNLGTAGLIVATGNVTGGNLITGGILSVTGNANVGNLGTSGLIVATGNITGGNLLGIHANGNSNVNIPTANGNVTISVTGTANVVSISSTSANITGNVSVSANLTANNITSNNIVKTSVLIFASLPTAVSAGAGARAFISDGNLAMSGNFGAIVSGGGSNNLPIVSDGTNWLIG